MSNTQAGNAALIERFDKNLADFHASLESFTPRELIGMADRIAATNRIHAFMTQEHGMSDEEVDFLLQFQNPLEVVADAWRDAGDDAERIASVAYDVFDKRDALAAYPLMTDLPPGIDPADIDFDGKERFMGVDLIDFLGKIAGKVIVHYPQDWQTDVERLYTAAGSDNPEDKRMMWHVSSWGTHMNRERETFIRDTGAYNTWVQYPRRDSDTFGYAVEITGRKGHIITGNVFVLGYYPAHVMHVREEALVLEMLTLTYADSWGVNAGKAITVPRFEYDDDRHRLMSESGSVTDIAYHPYEGVRKMTDLLRSERAERMSYPIGSMEAHLRHYDDMLADEPMPPADNIRLNTTKTIYGTVQPGDWVIATNKSDYAYLIGMVKAIEKHGAPEHDTENETDDIHVDFTAFAYPPERIAEIEEHFSGLYGERKNFKDLPLDDVIMAPKMLIGISHLGQEEIARMGSLLYNCESFCNGFPGAVTPQNEQHAALIRRIEKNLEAYHDSLMGFDKRELIDMTERTHAMSDAYAYLCYGRFEDGELAFLLQFKNPLEVVAEGWQRYNRDIDDNMDFAFADIMRHKENWLARYPLMDTESYQPDCRINNEPSRRADVTNRQTHDEIAELAPQTSPPTAPKPSISDKLRAGKEKVNANRAKSPAASTKKREKEIE
jgi:hypothetical protein